MMCTADHDRCIMSDEAKLISSDVAPVTTNGLAGYGSEEGIISRKKRPRGRPPGPRRHPVELVDSTAAYSTPLGAAYVGDAAALLKSLPDHSVNAIITSPPYALHFKKKYGNPNQEDYVDWFLQFVPELRRVLRPNGSLILEIGGAWNRGEPTRSIYHFELLVRIVREQQFHLAEEFFWFNRARIPSPAEWVNVQRIRVKDAVTPIWWLSPSPRPAANNKRVLRPYSPRMLRLLRVGGNHGRRPSGHVANKFEKNNRGAIPPNLIEVAHTNSNDQYQEYCRRYGLVAHPARFPRQVPEFFTKFLTRKGDLILDPFCGSNTTGAVAEKLGRRWLAFDLSADYIEGSIGRFDSVVTPEMLHSRRVVAR
jgi:DNA modification methylase